MRSLPRLRSPCSWIAALGLLLAAARVEAQTAEEALRPLLEALAEKPPALKRALSQYDRLESSAQIDVFGRQKIHERLLEEILKLEPPALAEEADRVFQSAGKSNLPSRILVLKSFVGASFPASREDRVAWLARAARGKEERLSIWAVRLLGDSRWPESVVALIEIMKTEETAKRTAGLLFSLASSELYRLLGAEAERRSSYVIEENWKKRGGKLPEKPDYRPGAGGSLTGFFGDWISPRSVFVIDTSSSMLQPASLRSGATSITSKKEQPKEAARERRIDIVKRELQASLQRLQPANKFNVVSYNTGWEVWRGKGPVKLYEATAESVKSAQGWAQKLATGSGTNIHDSLAAALESEADTVYLLTDGKPSVGGDAPAIEARAAALNYLKGIRISTYGFAPEDAGSLDEDLLRRLAEKHRGWYRRLN